MQRLRPARTSPLIRILSSLILKIWGWKVEPGDILNYPQSVLVGAYHTSNWDGLLAITLPAHLDVRIRFMIKDAWMKKPIIGRLVRWLGGYGVDRSKSSNVVDQVVAEFDQREQLIIGIAPEGTRKRVDYWKSGFYHIALQAGVPIIPAFADYERKVGGFGPAIMPTGDIEADMDKIREFFQVVHPKYPENAGPIRLRPVVVETVGSLADQQQQPG